MKGHSTASEPEQLFCYKLAPLGALAQAEDQLARVIRKELGVADLDRHVVEVTPRSGWIRYRDRERLWKSRPAFLPTREQARARAEAWMRTYADLMTNNPALPDSVRSLRIAPGQAKPQELGAIANMAGNGFDHWLYRAQPLLPVSTTRQTAQLMGSAFEIRIGEGGDVIAFTVRWRALTGATTRVQRSPETPRILDEPSHHDEPSHRDDHDHSELVYVLDGELSPQEWLTPYYLRGTGHEITYATASAASLTIDFFGRNTNDAAELTAFVMGGSGDYEVRWGIAPLEAPLEMTRIKEHRNKTIGTTMASTVLVPVGAYLVIIDARDRQSGAMAFSQQQALCGGVMADGSLAQPRDSGSEPPVA